MAFQTVLFSAKLSKSFKCILKHSQVLEDIISLGCVYLEKRWEVPRLEQRLYSANVRGAHLLPITWNRIESVGIEIGIPRCMKGTHCVPGNISHVFHFQLINNGNKSLRASVCENRICVFLYIEREITMRAMLLQLASM